VTDEQNTTQSLIGAVVIGRNEGGRLRRCLESVRDQVHHVVYVDSGSSDGSVELAKQTGIETIGLTQGPFTAALGRRTGLDHLLDRFPDMRYVQFIDGDCVLRLDWIGQAAAYLDAHDDVAAVCARRREEHAHKTLYNAIVDIDWDIPPGEVPYVGGDSLIRVESMQAADGWPVELIAGEEPDLCFRMRKHGWKIIRLDCEATLHDVAMTRFGQYWRRSVRSGHAYLEVGLRHRDSIGRPWLRMTVSNMAYGIVLPAVAIGGAWWHWLIPAAIGLLYVRLIVAMTRSCLKRDYGLGLSLAYALCNTICKVAGAFGAIGFVVGRLVGRRSMLIEYKRVSGGDDAEETPCSKQRGAS